MSPWLGEWPVADRKGGSCRAASRNSRAENSHAAQEQAFEERTRLLALTADVGRALTTGDSLADMLAGCAEALVESLDAAFARVWVLNEAEDMLELRASAGLYTHLDGPHGRCRSAGSRSA